MALLATSFKGNTKERRATKNLMKWLMPWHAPTGAAGGRRLHVHASLPRLAPAEVLTILPGSLHKEMQNQRQYL